MDFSSFTLTQLSVLRIALVASNSGDTCDRLVRAIDFERAHRIARLDVPTLDQILERVEANQKPWVQPAPGCA